MASPRVLAAILAAVGLATTTSSPARAAGAEAPAAEAPATDQASPPARRGPVRAELEIEALLGDDSIHITERARVRGEALLRAQEVLPARDADDARIRIRIEALDDGSGYRCHYGAYRGDTAIAGSDGVSMCELCTQAELVDHIEAAIERVVPRLPAGASAPAPSPTPAVADSEPARLGVLGKTGIGLTSVGVAGVIAGAVLVSRPDATRDSGIDRVQTDFRTPGIAVLSIGLGALVAGVTLLVVDRVRAKRGRARTAWRGAPVLRF